MTILDFAYREVSISSIGAGGVGVHDNFTSGSIAKAIIDFCTAPECGMTQIKYNTSYDYAVAASRLPVGEDVEGSVSMSRAASPDPTQVFISGTGFSARRFKVGEYINVLTSANTGVLTTGVKAISSSGIGSSGGADNDNFGLPCVSGGSIAAFNVTFTTAVTRKVFALQRGAVTYVFTMPEDESLFTLQPHKLTLGYKMLETPYAPGSSRVNNTVFPPESTSRSSPSTPADVPCESVVNYLTRLLKLHCFKCKDSFYFYVEKTDGSFTSFMFGKGDIRGNFIGGETTSSTFFDSRFMHKPAPSFYHVPMFGTFCSAINPSQVPDPYSNTGSIQNSNDSNQLFRFAATKFRCHYPAARKGAKETVSSPPNAKWCVAGHSGPGRDSAGVTGSGCMEWFTAVGAGTPVASTQIDGYVPGWVQAFGGLHGQVNANAGNPAGATGSIRQADPSTTTAPSGAATQLLFGPDNSEGLGVAMGAGTVNGRDDAGRAGYARHCMFSSLGQNVNSPNGWNNRIPGHEVELFVKDYRTDEEAGVTRLLDAMVMPGIRVGNVRKFEAKEIVNSDWMVFPVSKFVETLSANYDASSFPACYGLGYFVKKGTSI